MNLFNNIMNHNTIFYIFDSILDDSGQHKARTKYWITHIITHKINAIETQLTILFLCPLEGN